MLERAKKGVRYGAEETHRGANYQSIKMNYGGRTPKSQKVDNFWKIEGSKGSAWSCEFSKKFLMNKKIILFILIVLLGLQSEGMRDVVQSSNKLTL